MKFKVSNLFLLLALWFVAIACDDCYKLDEARVVGKADKHIEIEWMGETKKLKCTENSLFDLIDIGSSVYIVTGRGESSSTLYRIASREDLIDFPCSKDMVLGPFYEREDDGEVIHANKNSGVLIDGVAVPIVSPDLPKEPPPDEEEDDWIEKLWNEEK